MTRKKFDAGQIIGHLRTIEVLLSKGKTAAEASREVGITEQTYYRWRKEYGGMQVSQARRLKELEKENSRLKKAVASQCASKTQAGGAVRTIRYRLRMTLIT
jgi:putative transposase